MKPVTGERLKDTDDALFFIDTRAGILHSLCTATRDVAEYTNSEKPKEALACIMDLLLVIDDEIGYLQEEINAAFDVARKERQG